MSKTALKNCIKLSSKVTVYVPATNNVNEPIDNAKYVDEAAALLSQCFGGATSTPALGYWLSPSKGLTKEATTIVFAYAREEDLTEHIDDVVTYCDRLKQRLSQDSVAVEVNGNMYFV
jgi:hypothetical protein